MTCSEFLALLDEMIESNELRADLKEHLACCEHCEVTLNTTRKTIQIYRSHQIYEMPPACARRLHAAIMARCKKGC